MFVFLNQSFWSDACMIGVESHMSSLPMLEGSREQSQVRSQQ